MLGINKQEILANLPYSESDIVLSVHGVSKKFCRNLKRSLLYGVQDIASELLGLREKSENLRPKEFWALKDVSFQLKRGEALGLVGKNGSGKSTMLRIIAGLIKPDTGFVEINGRVAPLIALGAGFNPILTGRENIYANMSILGLSKKEIDKRFDEVVEFAEIGDAIDAPVQSYSSGMAARLGFASAIHTEPDILLIDEVLAVGDVKFRVKCVRKLYELREKGTSFIMVSHNHDALTTVCESGVYLLKGVPIICGDIRSVMDKYESDLFVGSKKLMGMMQVQHTQSNGTDLVIESITLINHNGKISDSIFSGKPAHFSIVFTVNKHIKNVQINLQIDSGDVGQIIYLNSPDDNFLLDTLPGKYEIQIQLTYLVLGPGTYTMRVLFRKDNGDYIDRADSFEFAVEKTEGISYSRFYQPRMWKLMRNDEEIL
jgi:lipopolysaccharide transport system ATP-binding protein